MNANRPLSFRTQLAGISACSLLLASLPASVGAVGEPTCNGLTATIWVDTGSNHLMVGGSDAGTYLGTINGTSGNDVIVGTAGDDNINGNGGNDTICALDGLNVIGTGSGDDYILTGSGNDVVNAGEGSNMVSTGDGNDVINTGNGNDTADSGPGFDICVLGGGTNAGLDCESGSGFPGGSSSSSSSASSTSSSASSVSSTSSSASSASSSSSSSTSSSSSVSSASSSVSSSGGSGSSSGGGDTGGTVTASSGGGSGGGDGGDQNGGFRGSRLNESIAKMNMVLASYGTTNVPRGAFGGGTVRLTGDSLRLFCSMQRAIVGEAIPSIGVLAEYIALRTGWDLEFVEDTLRDVNLCDEIVSELRPTVTVAVASPTLVVLADDGLPESSNNVWNLCIRGKATLEDIRSNKDGYYHRSTGTFYPYSCDHYNSDSGANWVSPDDPFLTFRIEAPAEGSTAPVVSVPEGYALVPSIQTTASR